MRCHDSAWKHYEPNNLRIQHPVRVPHVSARTQQSHMQRCFAERSMRGFMKQLKEVVAQADVLLQVLDARDPLACRSLDIERYVRSVDASKRIVLVVNKAGAACVWPTWACQRCTQSFCQFNI